MVAGSRNNNWESYNRFFKNKNSITSMSISALKFHMSSGSHKMALAAESSRCHLTRFYATPATASANSSKVYRIHLEKLKKKKKSSTA